MELISWAFVFIGVTGCLKSSACSKLTLLAFCIHVSISVKSAILCKNAAKVLKLLCLLELCTADASANTSLSPLADMTSVLFMLIHMPCSTLLC